jgi:dipeptidyl aminopeptidase/acylaminoacyl peptidase
MNVATKETWAIKMPSPPKGAKWTDPPKIVSKLNYRSDRVGFTDEGYRHIFILPADGGTARQITTGDFNYQGFDFSPDGKTLVFSGNRSPNAEAEFRRSHIYAANVETGEIKQITNRRGSSNGPQFSADGKYISFMHADSVDHSAWAESKLWMMNADGSNARLVSGNIDRPISGVFWAEDNSGIFFNAESEGSKNFYFAPLGGAYHAVTAGKHMLTVTAVSKNGLAVGVRSTPTKPNDVVSFMVPKTGTVTSFNQMTSVNDDVLTGKELAQTEEIWYTSKDNLKIQGWIVKPPGFDASKKYPLILEIHGGPQSMYNVAFNFSRQDHAANGYVILYTNPRGSTGYGEKFTNEIKNAYPGKDYDDLMAGVDTVINRGYVDTKNMFVYGCSGGGVLTPGPWVTPIGSRPPRRSAR